MAAVQRKIFYNHHGDHDPHGLIFVPLADAENPVPYFDYPRVPLDMPHKPSMRVSLNPQFLHYDPVCDSGINVGYNNGSRLWRRERARNICGTPTRSTGLHYSVLRRYAKPQIPRTVWNNYHRARRSKMVSQFLPSDPATPVFRAYTGERVVFRTMMPADKPRNVGFVIHGSSWKEQPENPYSRVIPMQGAISIGNSFQMELKDRACCPGDYLYRSGSLRWDVESGMWGIFRVMKQGIRCKCKNVCRKIMNCVGR